MFMIPCIRNEVLGFDCPGSMEPKALLMEALKDLFKQLGDPSQEECLDTKELLNALELTGFEIADAAETLNHMLDKMSSVLGDGKRKAMLGELEKVVCNSIKCLICPHVREREDRVLCLALPVRGISSLQESLMEFTQPDPLVGDNQWMCTECGVKVDAELRHTLKTLPGTMIFELKRYEFDFETMEITKLKHDVSFPMTLDMAPYTTAHLEPTLVGEDAPDADASPQLYELCGIVQHVGSARGGHYTSFVKERSGTRWVRCSDNSQVADWDASTQMAADCFSWSRSGLLCDAQHSFTPVRPLAHASIDNEFQSDTP